MTDTYYHRIKNSDIEEKPSFTYFDMTEDNYYLQEAFESCPSYCNSTNQFNDGVMMISVSDVQNLLMNKIDFDRRCDSKVRIQLSNDVLEAKLKNQLYLVYINIFP